MDRIQIGTNVDIKRTDGRIHGALVSGINTTSRSVTVEWFEKGETKGKEVELEQVLELNPHLLNNNAASSAANASINVAEVTRMETAEDDKRISKVTRRQPTVHQSLTQKEKSSSQLPPQKSSVIRQTIARPPVVVPTAASNGHRSQFQNAHGALTEMEEDEENEGTVGAAGAGKRKSNTVQEIERLQKNREERRARQEEVRQQKQELMNIDPGNPNWAFLGMIREYREKLEFHPLRINDQIEDHQICVCVRKRPLNKKELTRREIEVISVPNRDHVIVHQPQTKVDLTKYLENQTFRFDYAFDESSTNEMVYKFTAQPLVKTIFDQGFATCFAYGQTGSGKTHTMGGEFQGKSQEVSKGIYAMTTRDVFKYYNKHFKAGPKDAQLSVSCSFFEIYSGKVFDLLNNKAKLRVLEDGKGQVQIVGLQEAAVENEQDVLDLIRRGSEVRTAGQTSANSQSSRSHAIFQIILRKRASKKLHGKFSLVDLAGNERGADTASSSRQTRMEGAEINKSLLCLKECIRALGRRNAPHLPFRASKLTLVLRDSFIGDNARTCMIAMISPGLNSCEHTLNTLRYANRVKELGAEPEAIMKGAAGAPVVQNGVDAEDLRSEDSDLALLHSHNEDELSNDLYEFQMVVDQMQQQEERVFDEHAKLVYEMDKCSKQHKRLLQMTETVDYESEQYARELLSLLQANPLASQLKNLQEQVEKLLGHLQQEETAALKTASAKKPPQK